MSEVTIETVELSHLTIVRVTGDLHDEYARTVNKKLRQLADEDQHHIVLNLTEANFITYMFIGMLIERLRFARSHFGDIRIVATGDYLSRLLRMAGVSGLFPLFESEQDAVKAFEDGES